MKYKKKMPFGKPIVQFDASGLLNQIYQGRANLALKQINTLLKANPKNPALLILRAEALRAQEMIDEAIEAFIKAGNAGCGADAWHRAGVLLTACNRIDEALECLEKALACDGSSETVIDTLITTLFNSGRYEQGVLYARLQARRTSNLDFRARAALFLSHCGFNDESAEIFKSMIDCAQANNLPPLLLGPALSAVRFVCDWDLVHSLQSTILSYYAAEKFGVPAEFPLTNVTWCNDERYNLGVTKAYLDSKLCHVSPLPQRKIEVARKIRIGYVSNDFKNHATMQLMAGLFEHHDKNRFEVYAYDHTIPDDSQYRQRFLAAVDKHVDIRAMDDKTVADLIAHDQVDVLFDLKGHTGLGRLGIFSYRPAPIQVSYLGFPGSVAHPFIDYIVSDRFVTPDSSAQNYSEKFCRLPYSYQCNDRLRPHPPSIGSRSLVGLPDDAIVYCAFNQSYKIDKTSFLVWMKILKAVPNSVLWIMANNSKTAEQNLSYLAYQCGIESERIIFAPFAPPYEHLARLQLADAALDTLICNGHTTTSDALWVGVPVVSARGSHFASRVSESLLNAMNLPELVGRDHEDMVRIASKIGLDGDYRSILRKKVSSNRLITPLFDIANFAKYFEVAIEMMVANYRLGNPPKLIDVLSDFEL